MALWELASLMLTDGGIALNSINLFTRFIAQTLKKKLKKNKHWLLRLWLSRVFNFQTQNRAFEVGKVHYNLGNELFKAMLYKRLTYTCGYWKNANNLDEAQEAKLDLVCRKLNLKPGMKILDIGCGWGSFLRFAAEKYGISGVGITVSEEQAKLAKNLCANLPVEIRFNDYRELNASNVKFDHVVSLGMFEHVGYKNYKTYMQTVHHCLKDDGLFLLHTIGNNTTLYNADEWISKYIFPNGMAPSGQDPCNYGKSYYQKTAFIKAIIQFAKSIRHYFKNEPY